MYTQKTESFAYDCVKMFIVFTLNEFRKTEISHVYFLMFQYRFDWLPWLLKFTFMVWLGTLHGAKIDKNIKS